MTEQINMLGKLQFRAHIAKNMKLLAGQATQQIAINLHLRHDSIPVRSRSPAYQNVQKNRIDNIA